MKSQFERSVRTYDGAVLTWRRDRLPEQYDWSFWYLVKVENGPTE